MTLIVAIQMEDSVIVAADNRVVTPSLTDGQKNHYHSDQGKLHPWHGGVVTGCGEIQVPQEIRAWLQKNSELELLAERLRQIKKERIIEAGYHEQIADSKVLFTIKQNNKPQLYLLGLQPSAKQAEPNELAIFCPLKPNLLVASAIALKKLHSNIRPRHDFKDHQSWASHYMSFLTDIYDMQSKETHQVSASFDIFFQSNSDTQIIHCNNSNEIKIVQPTQSCQ